MSAATPMRVWGYSSERPDPAATRLGFSPKANLMPGMAPSAFISSGWRAPQRSLMTAFWPPMALAEPCSRLAAVRPPASCR